MHKSRLTQDDLKAELDYCPDTGVFIRARGPRMGYEAGHPNEYRNGAIQIRVGGRRGVFAYAHHLAFLYMENRWPKEVDHIDGDPSNNRWNNLRECSRVENCQNMRKSVANTSGVKGVTKDKGGKWRARIRVNKDMINLGLYDSIAQAEAVVTHERNNLHGEFSNHGTS